MIPKLCTCCGQELDSFVQPALRLTMDDRTYVTCMNVSCLAFGGTLEAGDYSNFSRDDLLKMFASVNQKRLSREEVHEVLDAAAARRATRETERRQREKPDIRTACILMVQNLIEVIEEGVNSVWFDRVGDDDPDPDAGAIREIILAELTSYLAGYAIPLENPDRVKANQLTLENAAAWWDVEVEPHHESFIVYDASDDE